jgi:Ni/Co efflux regulator RcnB
MDRRAIQLAIFATLALFVCDSAYAKKPVSPGNSGKQNSAHENSAAASSYRANANPDAYFNEERHRLIKNYFLQHKNPDNCPPGLAKKNNGCLPPGIAKKWRMGQPLPADVAYYELPGDLLALLDRVPEGQKIVRVGTDLLLISVGTGMVVDAIDDLGDVF